jgi:peptide chain release factor 2
MRDFSDDIADLTKRVADARAYLKVDELRERLTALEAEASKPDLWDDQEAARRVTTELSSVRDDVELVGGLEGRAEDLQTLFELGREEGDDSVAPEIESGIEGLRGELDRLELRALFTGEYDERDAICQVSSGAGGTDAQDWTQMLLRMFSRWAERRGFAVEVEDISEGTEAGISSATFTVKGRYAYGMLTGEKGVHRLIRISPFDANARRQTAFAAFDAVPALDRAEAPEIDPGDLRIDTYRSSGAGGQHVNVTDSAIRITHLPTGIVVSCQNERSQHKNRASGMKVLKSRLYDLKLKEQQAKLEQLGGEKKGIAFGSQIRSYVLHPYQMIKDHRTKYQVGDISRVLDGDIDEFIKAYLMKRALGKLETTVEDD